jgi:uroporphyrinogen III methyltransferase/synthase
VDFIPSKYTTEVFAQEFAGCVKPEERVLIPRAAQGGRELISILQKNKIDFDEIQFYDVQGQLTGNIRCLNELDYLVFVSASGVTAFFEQLRKENRFLPENLKLACIGEVTRKRLLEEYGQAHIVASVSDVEGLARVIAKQVCFEF